MKGRTKVAMVLISAALTVLATSSGAPADSAATCLGERATIVGTEGDDLIAGTSKDDVIVALGGNDVINAHGGDDLVCAGDGNDRIDAGDGFFDGIDGGVGDDWIDGGDAALTIAIYKDSPGPVVVDLSARTASGDGTDTLANVNSVVGSDFDDVLTGDGRMNLIAGEDVQTSNLAAQQRFYNAHLRGWIDAFCDVLEAHPRADFYRSVAAFTRDFAAVEAQGLDLLDA